MGIASRELPTPGCSPMYNGADPAPSPGTDKGLCWGNPCSFISESRLPWPQGWHIAQTEETAAWREAWMLSVALHHGEPTPLTPPALQPSPWGCLHRSEQAGKGKGGTELICTGHRQSTGISGLGSKANLKSIQVSYGQELSHPLHNIPTWHQRCRNRLGGGRRGTGPSPMLWKPCQFGQLYQPLAPCPCPVQHPWLSDVEHRVREELPFFCPKVLVDACRCCCATWP